MAVTVVSVVIFLCGVLVGRGVRSERATAVLEAAGVGPVAAPDAARTQPPSPSGSDPRTAAPPPLGEDLTYFGRLEKKTTPAEHLKPEADKTPAPIAAAEPLEKPVRAPAAEKTAAVRSNAAAAPPSVPSPRPSAAAAAPAARPSADAPAGEPQGQGFVLQVTALRESTEAEAIARRLSAKGYAAYVLRPVAGTPPVYRVRVGKFKTRREAETMATKLQKEEQFTPWITR